MKLYYYGLGLFGTVALGVVPLYLVGSPTVYFPLPFYIVFSSFFRIHLLICLAVFFISSILVFNKPDSVFKKRAVIINILITLGTVVWLILSKDYGVRYQGVFHYWTVLTLNACSLILLWWLSFSVTPKKMFTYSLALPFFLVWLAFPYLGELV